MRKQISKKESGAQLMTRLGSRLDISKVDLHLFGSDSSPSLSSSLSSHAQGVSPKGKSTSSSSGRLLEIYGPEGVGKTELALHYLARICLPQFWNNRPIGGVGAKGVIVDTDFKFSVLRLAVIMEKQILSLHEMAGKHKNMESELPHAHANGAVPENEEFLKDESNSKKQVNLKGYTVENNPTRTRGSDVIHSMQEGWNSLQEQSAEREKCTHLKGHSKPDEADMGSDSDKQDKQENEEESDSSGLTSQDVEDIVQESLERVHVVKPNSCQQLFMTLLSLEMALASDLQTAILLIDSISAFFWEDRLAESNFGSAPRTKTSPAAGGMSHIAGVISRLVSKLGVTVLTTKAPLLGGFSSSSASFSHTSNRKRKREEPKDEMGVGNSSVISTVEEGAVEDDHVEFMGKAWVNLNPRRIVLSEDTSIIGNSVTSSGDTSLTSVKLKEQPDSQRVITASCSCWPSKKQFTFIDDALQFL